MRRRTQFLELSDEGRQALAEIVKKELVAVVSAESALTLEKMQQMHKIIAATMPLFQSGIPARQAGKIIGGPMVSYPADVVGGGAEYFDGGDDDLNLGLGTLQNPLSPSTPQETFGAKALRELVSAIPKLLRPPPSLIELVASAAAAKNAGMTELQHDIEAQIALRMSQHEPDKGEEPPLYAPEMFKRQDKVSEGAGDGAPEASS